MKPLALALLVVPTLLVVVFTGACRSGSGRSAPHDGAEPDWSSEVVFMEVFVRSYQDSDGDGIGDLTGLTERLPYLADLGIGGLWLMPIFPTAFTDSGYDVADYTAIHPEYGTLADFDAFLARAHELGIRVLLDGVFNHTSHRHAWFVESRSSRESEKRDWYIWADEPLHDCPNRINASDPTWTWDEATKQYYFHFFRPSQPDLNLANPDVREAIKDVLRFWLDRGVDGFRLDVPTYYFEDEGTCEHHPETHALLKGLRSVLDGYPNRTMIGETSARPLEVIGYFGDDVDELPMILDFYSIITITAAAVLGTPLPVDAWLGLMHDRFPEGGQAGIFTQNHDFIRVDTLLLHDPAKQKLVAAALLTLPGTPFLYYGQEIGMASGLEQVIDYRDASRTPMQWDASRNAGFTTGAPWIAMAPGHRRISVASQETEPDSLLSHYRRMIALRNNLPSLRTGTFRRARQDAPSVFAYFRGDGEDAVLVALNFGGVDAEPTVDLTDSPWDGRSGDLEDLFRGEPAGAVTPGAPLPIALPARGFVILGIRG